MSAISSLPPAGFSAMLPFEVHSFDDAPATGATTAFVFSFTSANRHFYVTVSYTFSVKSKWRMIIL